MWRAMVSVRLMWPSPRLSCAYSRIVRVRTGVGRGRCVLITRPTLAAGSVMSDIRFLVHQLQQPVRGLLRAVQRDDIVGRRIVGSFQIRDQPLRQRLGTQL